MRRVGSIGMAVYGTASFRKASRNRWGELPWLMFHDDLADMAEMKWLAKNVPGAQAAFRCSSMTTLVSACEAGLGVAVLPCLSIKATRLVRLSEAPVFQRDLWLLKHRQAAKIRRFRAVADWIASIAEKDASLLAGEDQA
jgi:DNA-binding transcriptional LysR family regulator